MSFPELTTKFHLSEDQKSLLDKYYLLKWKGDYLSSQIDNFSMLLAHQGVEYTVILTRPLDVIEPECQYKLSFRHSASSGISVVLIKKVYPK